MEEYQYNIEEKCNCDILHLPDIIPKTKEEYNKYFPNTILKKLENYFCSNNDLSKCTNFKKLYLHVPLLRIIFEKKEITEIKFTEEPINQDYYETHVTYITKILLNLVNKISCKTNKLIIILVMFNFIIQNIKYLINDNNFAKAVIRKFEELLKEPEIMPIIKKFNINYVKWYEIMQGSDEN
jgi:hypothetical protein